MRSVQRMSVITITETSKTELPGRIVTARTEMAVVPTGFQRRVRFSLRRMERRRRLRRAFRWRAVVGHLMKAASATVGAPWLWTLAFGQHEDRTPTHGYEATREAAMAG
jgi:hypothetical protein